MYMSVEVLTAIISGAGVLVAMFAGFGWVVHRMDARFEQVDARFAIVEHEISDVRQTLATEISDVRQTLSTEISDVRRALATEIADVRREVGDVRLGLSGEISEVRVTLANELSGVKSAIARLEGPPHRLIPAR